jgi:hypothetical protein
MEFNKNRQGVLLTSTKELTPPQSISIPAFLTSSDTDHLEKQLNEAQRLFKNLKKQLLLILKEPDTYDPVYKVFQDVFNKKGTHYYGHEHADWKDIKDSALTRHQLGYPPRKPDDTSMGDAVNWEWIIYCAKITKSNVALISRDHDYGQFHDDKSYLNDHLQREFLDRVGKEHRISLHRKLTPILKDFHVTVTEKEQQEENRIIQSSERANPIISLQNNWSTFLEAYQKAIAPSVLSDWFIREVTKQRAAAMKVGGEGKDPS